MHEPQSRRLQFGLAACLFFLVVVNRSSLGVAGQFAETRFGIGPGGLSVFVMLQLTVYAALQIPAGALADRFGARRTLVVAGVLVGVAQLMFGLSRNYPAALAARIVLGCGDALTFVSVLRVAATTVGRQRYPALVALTGLVGVAGNLVATLPLLLVLRTVGWEHTFSGLAMATATVALAVHLGLRDRVVASLEQRGPQPSAGFARSVLRAWQQPETRLGFWLHFSSLATAMTLLLLWGYPYLTRGAGMDDAGAGSVMLAGVLLSAAFMPVAGWWFGKRPDARVPTVLAVVSGIVVLWVLVLTLGASPPHALVAGAFIASMLGVPASGAAFAVVRDAVEADVVSTATGVVNTGGYLAAVLACFGVGLVLQLLGREEPDGFRAALTAMLLVQVVGVIRIRVWRDRCCRRTRSPRPAPLVRADIGGG